MSIDIKNLKLGYEDKIILNDISLEIPEGQLTIIIGCNGCGKSTLLKSMARLLKPISGSVKIKGRNIFNTPTKEVAKFLSILPQNPTAPDDLTVFDLVKQGRYPYQSWLKQWSRADEEAIKMALEETGITEIEDDKIIHLSGGQKQRAWISMTLAQETDIILLDEPTNHLDIKYRIEILDLLHKLKQKDNRTIIMVLHDINLACRYADNIVALRNGEVYANGHPSEIINEQLIKDVFDIDSKVVECPVFGTPSCIPFQGQRLN